MRVIGSIAAATVLVSGLLASTPVRSEPIATGRHAAGVNGAPLTVFAYRPAECSEPSLLLVFHGAQRDAADYRDHARPLAGRHCLLVIAPLFDRHSFPAWRYQRGGIVGKDGALREPREWTGRLVLDLVDWTRKQEGRPLAYSLIAHSAGGQFLSRLAAFVPTEARRIVLPTPGPTCFRVSRSTRPTGSERSMRERTARRSCGAISSGR